MTMSPSGDRLAAAAEHHRQGRLAEAIALYRALLAQRPGDATIAARLASALRSHGRPEEALAIYDSLEADFADNVDFWFNRGNTLADLARHAEADVCFARAIDLDPDQPHVILNRAIARGQLADSDAAIDLYRRVLDIDPDNRTAIHNLGNLLAEDGRQHEAIARLRLAASRWPDLAEAHYNLALVLLRSGDYANGAAEYEWRWQAKDFPGRPDYGSLPGWDGRPFAGRRLVVHAEQGLGDTLQFSKLLGALKSLGGDVIFHVPEPLVPLMRSLPFDIAVTARHRQGDADMQVALMSLIHRLKLTPGSIPRAPSYLSASEADVRQWTGRLGLGAEQMSIGLVWQGNPASPVDRGRSLPSAVELAPFAAIENVRLIALQKLGPDALEPAPAGSGWRVRGLPFTLEHPGPDYDAGVGLFLDSAAIMTSLDLIVSVCTAPLHLAGALGRPAIGLLKQVPDWRWMTGTEVTPWYPAMALVRQNAGETFGPAIMRAVSRAKEMLRR